MTRAGVGIALRRLRPLLPEQARGRGYRAAFIYTRAACKLLDLETCRCTDYANRQARVPDCVALTPENVGSLGWLPATCAYRLLDEGKNLEWWHPLVSGRPETVAEAGITVTGEAYSEEGITVEELVDHIWRMPKAKRKQIR